MQHETHYCPVCKKETLFRLEFFHPVVYGGPNFPDAYTCTECGILLGVIVDRSKHEKEVWVFY